MSAGDALCWICEIRSVASSRSSGGVVVDLALGQMGGLGVLSYIVADSYPTPLPTRNHFQLLQGHLIRIYLYRYRTSSTSPLLLCASWNRPPRHSTYRTFSCPSLQLPLSLANAYSVSLPHQRVLVWGPSLPPFETVTEKIAKTGNEILAKEIVEDQAKLAELAA